MKKVWFSLSEDKSFATVSQTIKHPTKEMLEQIMKMADDGGAINLTIKGESRDFNPALCTRSKLPDNHRWEILHKVTITDSSGNVMQTHTDIVNSFYFNAGESQPDIIT